MRGAHAREPPSSGQRSGFVGPDTAVFRVEGSVSLPVRADTRQRLGRREVPQADRLTVLVMKRRRSG
jgi:hypothetical protein